MVISFGDEFPYRADDQKFVFWSEMNYVPAWHMDKQLLYIYEFAETWGGGVHGCIRWDDHYKTDARGRKYREWVSLVGLNPPGDLDRLRAKTASWLYPGRGVHSSKARTRASICQVTPT